MNPRENERRGDEIVVIHVFERYRNILDTVAYRSVLGLKQRRATNSVGLLLASNIEMNAVDMLFKMLIRPEFLWTMRAGILLVFLVSMRSYMSFEITVTGKGSVAFSAFEWFLHFIVKNQQLDISHPTELG